MIAREEAAGAILSPDVLEKIAGACVRCWKETHRPPARTAIYLWDDYKWAVGHQVMLQDTAVRLACADGLPGHRERPAARRSP